MISMVHDDCVAFVVLATLKFNSLFSSRQELQASEEAQHGQTSVYKVWCNKGRITLYDQLNFVLHCIYALLNTRDKKFSVKIKYKEGWA